MDKRENYIKFFAISFFIAVILFALNSIWFRTYGGDTEWYIKAAEGRWHELIQPYSARFLHPFLVGSLSNYLSLSIEHTFLVIGVVSVFLFFILNAVILKKTINIKPVLLIPLFLTPYFLLIIREVFQPDAFYIFLTALFFLLLFYRKEAESLLIFFLIFLTRESTILFGAIWGAINWIRSKKFLAPAVFLVLIISFLTVSSIGSLGKSNIHNLNSSFYLFAKLSFNFLTNILGVKPWTNTYGNCEPLLKLTVPEIEYFGEIKEIGFCGFNLLAPIQTLIIMLTVFGITPLLFFYLFFKKWKFIFKRFPLWLVLALVYGLVHYFIGAIAGTGIARIVGYSWPVFLILTPIMMKLFLDLDKRLVIKLSIINFFAAWLPLIIYRLNGDNINSALFILAITLGIYLYGFINIKRLKINSDLDLLLNTW